VDTRTETKTDNMLGGHSKLEILLYNQASGILALSSADKRISLINTRNLKEKALAIEEHSLNNSKVKCMCFNTNGTLYALTDDNKIRYWNTNIDKYAQTIEKMPLKQLNDDEWDLILGREFTKK
jgi:WD40 repeat protein